MAAARSDIAALNAPASIHVTRVFDAPRDMVFAAWTTAEHLKRWFGPRDFTIPFCVVDFRVGGTFRLCLIAPDGREVWARGVFREIVPNERIVFDDILLDDRDNPRFEVLTTVTFADEGDKTRLTVDARVTAVFDPSSAPTIARMEEGWRQTVERLAFHIAGGGKPS